MQNKFTGSLGEDLACQYLRKRDYEIIQRNYLIRGGEIDIITKDGNILVFVEVKTRYSHEYGLPIESITKYKIKSLLKTAQFYILKSGWGNRPFRLDFISVDFADSRDQPQIELIKNITF